MPYALPENIAAGVKDWNRQLSRIDQVLSEGGPYIAGEHFTIADIPLGLMVHRWQFIEFEKPTLAAVNAYYKLLGEREGFRLHGCNGVP